MTCTRPGCDRTIRARGLCTRHYRELPRPLPCTVNGCDKPASTPSGRCNIHGHPPGCKVDGCDRGGYGGGLCEPHYRRQQRYGDTLAHIPIGQLLGWNKRQCEADDCTRTAEKRGLCRRHYQIARRAGEFDTGECLVCVDAEWLIRCGETPGNVATRLGFVSAVSEAHAVDNVRLHLRRHNRRDLADRLRERSYS